MRLLDARRVGPLSAKGDPITSRFAGRHAEASGLRGRQMAAVVELVRSHPALTSAEIAALDAAHGLSRHAIARRLPDAEKRGLVTKSSIRPCSISGRLSVVWVAIDDARQHSTATIGGAG